MYNTEANLTTKFGPIDNLWQLWISCIQSDVVIWSSVASSRTPHLISTTWRRKHCCARKKSLPCFRVDTKHLQLKKINKQRFIVYTKFYNSYGLNDTIDVSKISNPKVKCKLYWKGRQDERTVYVERENYRRRSKPKYKTLTNYKKKKTLSLKKTDKNNNISFECFDINYH
jgi:hypothetical protein